MMDDALIFTNNVFFICFGRNKETFSLKFLCKSCGLFVTERLPSECRDRNSQNESEKQDTITFCTNLPKKERGPYMEMSRDKEQKMRI